MSGVRPRLVILVGPRGSGKTMIGSRLAEVFPVYFFPVEAVLQENAAHPDGLTGEALAARGSQRVLARLVEQAKLNSAIVIESSGEGLATELDRYSRVFQVIPVRVRAPPGACLARSGLKQAESSAELSLDWAMTYDNPDPLPTRAQLQQAFAPLFSSSFTSFASSSSATASNPHTLALSTESTAPVTVIRLHEPAAPGSRGEPRSCLKQKTAEPRRGVQWDEPNLQQNEDEKVPRMKIDEPKTPFNHSMDAEEEDEGAPVAIVTDSDEDEEMRPPRRGPSEQKSVGIAEVDLGDLASEAMRRREEEWEESEGDDFMTYKEKKLEQQRQAEFEEKRKRHYNMGSLLKKKKPTVEEDED